MEGGESMEKVRMEEVETMAVELLPDREEMQASVTITGNVVADNAGVGANQAQGNGISVGGAAESD
jgi:hypothetical protein